MDGQREDFPTKAMNSSREGLTFVNVYIHVTQE